MHLAQKRAIFGMVDAIESQLRYLKSIILMDESPEPSTAQHIPRGVAPERTPGNDQYLSIDEEKELAKRLEQARQEGMADEDNIRRAWRDQNEEMAAEGHGVMF